jgi:hypothetical protein
MAVTATDGSFWCDVDSLTAAFQTLNDATATLKTSLQSEYQNIESIVQSIKDQEADGGIISSLLALQEDINAALTNIQSNLDNGNARDDELVAAINKADTTFSDDMTGTAGGDRDKIKTAADEILTFPTP